MVGEGELQWCSWCEVTGGVCYGAQWSKSPALS
jgi:hypothetical protein